jgi:hypothetical protein
MRFCVHALAEMTIGDGSHERPVTQGHVVRRREKKMGRYLVSGARCRHGGEVRASAETSTFVLRERACAAAEVGFEDLHAAAREAANGVLARGEAAAEEVSFGKANGGRKALGCWPVMWEMGCIGEDADSESSCWPLPLDN